MNDRSSCYRNYVNIKRNCTIINQRLILQQRNESAYFNLINSLNFNFESFGLQNIASKYSATIFWIIKWLLPAWEEPYFMAVVEGKSTDFTVVWVGALFGDVLESPVGDVGVGRYVLFTLTPLSLIHHFLCHFPKTHGAISGPCLIKSYGKRTS